jgi:hypothetical protein
MKLLNAGLCLFFLAFATLRAARVPLTYDEAASYIRYIDSGTPSVFDTGALSIFNFEVATNHFLNTALAKVCTQIAGGSEFVLRVPNLLGYAMFMIFSVLILRRYVRPFIATAGFLFLNLNPYVLDFFTLSRGYGLSLGFLMAAMFWAFRCLDCLKEAAHGTREAAAALTFALGAVMSSFALLNVWLSIFGVLLAGFMLRNTVLAASGIPEHGSRITAWSAKVPLILAAALFIGLVFSQDSRLSSSLYEPVSVKITGLDQGQLDRVTVVRLDLLGRPTFFPHDAGASEWRWRDGVPFRGLRIELPAGVADRIEHIDVAMGSQLFSVDPGRGNAWSRQDRDSIAVFEAASLSLPRSRIRHFRAVLNWAGDARYATSLATATAVALGMLAVFAVALKAAGWAAVRLGMLAMEQWRPFESAALWVAALAGPPLYLLRRNAELYFGGTHGLVEDTFVSTIENSFYGRMYHSNQIQAVLLGVVISLALFCTVLYRSLRRHTWPDLLPASTVLTVLLLTSLSLVTQHVMFHTVYLVGRTALFYIPLYVLFAILLSEAIAASGRRAETLVIALFVGILSFSAYHFVSTANLKYAWDWREDASTRMMMEDLQQVIEAEGRHTPVVLGVDPAYIPVAAYYAHRSRGVTVEVVSSRLPDRAVDFLYGPENSGMAAIRRYPATRTVLVKMGA